MTSPEHPEQLRITVFGGGGGGSVLGGGLAEAMPNADISIVVPTGDSGSKTGELREMFGGPAVGDARKVLSAVAGNRDAGELFGKRYGEDATLYDDCAQLFDTLTGAGKDREEVGRAMGRTLDLADELVQKGKSLKGHTFGNLILTALSTDSENDIMAGVRTVSGWLDARANVIPVSVEPHNLMMYDKARNLIIKGEGFIDDYTPSDPSEVEVWLEPSPFSENRFIEGREEIREALLTRELGRRPAATKEAIGAIALSHVVALAPGSARTSHESLLRHEGIASAFQYQQDKNGLWVVVNNLFKDNSGLDLKTHLRLVEGAAGRPVTHFIHNTDVESLPEGKVPLRYDPNEFGADDARAVGAALVDSHLVQPDKNDPIAHLRSPGHHNAWKVAGLLGDIVKAV